MSAPLRVVLDTNVVLSALLSGGHAAGALRRGWQQGAFTPLASTTTAQELMRVLAYPKFRLSAGDQQELLADYLPYTTVVRIPIPPPSVPDCRDVLDLPFLHLVVVGKARWLVSGDRDLLVLADAFSPAGGCRIATMDAFVQSRALVSRVV